MNDETSTSWCLPSDDCTLHDYATFLSVSSALNITFFIWWNLIHGFIQKRLERSKNKRDEKLAETGVVREDDGGRGKCDTFVYWIKMAGRGSSALITVVVVAILLVFRSSTPMYFWWTASTILVGPLLMAFTFLVHWVWLCIIECADYFFARGAQAAKTKAKVIRSSTDDGADG